MIKRIMAALTLAVALLVAGVGMASPANASPVPSPCGGVLRIYCVPTTSPVPSPCDDPLLRIYCAPTAARTIHGTITRRHLAR